MTPEPSLDLLFDPSILPASAQDELGPDLYVCYLVSRTQRIIDTTWIASPTFFYRCFEGSL